MSLLVPRIRIPTPKAPTPAPPSIPGGSRDPFGGGIGGGGRGPPLSFPDLGTPSGGRSSNPPTSGGGSSKPPTSTGGGGGSSSGGQSSDPLSKPSRAEILVDGADFILGLIDLFVPDAEEDDGNDGGGDDNGDEDPVSCQFDGKKLDAAGFVPVVLETKTTSSSNSFLSDLSWTVTTSMNDTGISTGRAAVQRDFYLATNPSTSPSRLGGCALFFMGASDEVHYGKTGTSTQQGCEAAMSPDCVDEMMVTVSQINTSGLTSAQACAAMLAAFRPAPSSACLPFGSANSQWTKLEAHELFVDEPIDASEKAATACWPVKDKSSDLTRVTSVVEEGNDNTRFKLDTEFRTTPILTLFFPLGNNTVGNSPIISRAEAHMTCIKPVRREAVVSPSNTSSSGGNIQPPSCPSCGNKVSSAGARWGTLPNLKKLVTRTAVVAFMMMELFGGGDML